MSRFKSTFYQHNSYSIGGNRKTRSWIPILIVFAFLFTACTSPLAKQSAPIANVPEQAAKISPIWEQTPKVDEQGAVVVEVKPLNLNTQDNSLQFEIALNTHSVDLSMDISSLATLTTDTGMSIQSSGWDAPRGGHHVSGKLIFPSTVDGNSVLDGANRIKLQIHNVDAELREFEWNLQ